MQKKLYFNWLTVTLIFVLSAFGLTRCMDGDRAQAGGTSKAVDYKEFAGSEKCMPCHVDIYKKHILTGHFQTSASPTKSNIKGSFDRDENIYTYANGTAIKMEMEDGKFYQVAYINEVESKRKPIDMVIGSGEKGQSFATWNKDRLFQLPVTYFTETSQWCNSPGYPNRIVFNRLITSRCLECHTTFAQETISQTSKAVKFEKNEIIYGVTCEKCHGPGAEHVAYHVKNPNDKTGKRIVNPSVFSRQQSLDLCALCHGGTLEKTKPSFSFVAGNKLSDYFKWDTSKIAAANIDVHGNQYGLLRSSECFIKSNTLTCNTCHSPHENETLPTFSQKCMGCHSIEKDKFCSEKLVSTENKKANCIDCHMPKQASRSIAVFLPGQTSVTPSYIRTHLIAEYVDETKKFIEGLGNKKATKLCN